MNPTLYFLRSSEQYVLKKMVPFAFGLDTRIYGETDMHALEPFYDFYGYTKNDMGLYALINGEVAGAVWARKISTQTKPQGFYEENTPVLSIGVLPKFKNQGIGSAMMEQFLAEMSVLYKAASIAIMPNSHAESFLKKFDFQRVEGNNCNDIISGEKLDVWVKNLEKITLVRPSDGYNPNKWMD